MLALLRLKRPRDEDDHDEDNDLGGSSSMSALRRNVEPQASSPLQPQQTTAAAALDIPAPSQPTIYESVLSEAFLSESKVPLLGLGFATRLHTLTDAELLEVNCGSPAGLTQHEGGRSGGYQWRWIKISLIIPHGPGHSRGDHILSRPRTQAFICGAVPTSAMLRALPVARRAALYGGWKDRWLKQRAELEALRKVNGSDEALKTLACGYEVGAGA